MKFKCAFWLLLLTTNSWQLAASAISSADLPLEARDDSASQEEDFISTSYVLPNQIFNDGKPYYASKDPISGQLDFNAKKPAGIEMAVNEVIDPKEKIVLSNSSPNIHDYLNLPVKYSSSKFVYPLVSSSYANLKYQGSNKNFITNKKPISVEASAATPPPNYHNQQQQHLTVPTTKLVAVQAPAAQPRPQPTTSTTSSGSTTTTTTTTTTTSKKPAPPTAASTITTNAQPPPTSTSIKTSIATSTSMFTPPKYTSVTRRPIPVLNTTQPPKQITTIPTRKKFVPTKKYTPTATSPTAASTTKPTNPLRFPDKSSSGSPKPATTSTISISKQQTTTKPPISITEQQLPFSPTQQTQTANQQPSLSTTRIPNLDPADVYQTLEQKHGAASNDQKQTMTLADIFNSLAEEESAVASNNQGNQGLDAQGNLMQPLAPSKPAPFAMQNSNQQLQPQNAHQKPPQQLNNDQKVIAGSQENYSNEYVSYQVQQPNVMQYRPVPGAINNVVISPGQHSATFVLGSQQQVGHNAFGSAERESVRPVQYGTVINEPMPQKPGSFPTPASQPPAFQNLPNTGKFGNNDEPPPAAPSPYQQLPLVGAPNLRPQTNSIPQQSNQQQQHDPLLQPLQQQQQQQQESQSQLPTNYAPAAQQNSMQAGDTQEFSVSTNIRFPLNEEQSEEQLSGPVAAGPPTRPQVNGHAQPLSLQQIKQTNTVVFPKTKDEQLSQGEQYQGVSGAEDIQIQQHEVLTMNQHKQTLNFPEQQHTPSMHMEPPPLPPQPQQSNEHPEPQKRPYFSRPHGPPPFSFNEYTRKPIPGITRPNPDRKLPNILPQFRPNAKISSGHPAPANFNQEPGNIRIPPGPPGPPAPPLRRPPTNMASPQFAHRRQPLMQQPRYPTNRLVDFPNGPAGMPHPAEANRRVYRLPSFGGPGFPYADRLYARRPVPYAAVRPIADSYAVERHAPALGPEVYKTLAPQDPSLPPERMAAFEEEDLVINDPPQPVTPSKDHKYVDETKLEPVVTLQMLQSHKKPLSLPNDDTGSGEIQVPPESDNFDPNLEKPTAQNGLYVVYPMNGKKNGDSKVDDVLPAVAHVEPATGSEYQNTPFSVLRDQPEEPLLTVVKKKPQSLQQQSKKQTLKDKFPYPIEKPDPSFNELHVKKGVPGVLVAPRIVHGIYNTGTETPIAIAYTPTEPSSYRKHDYTKYSDVNLASSVIGEIRHETQTEEGISNDFDLRGQNFEKNFMAPFYPSVSLGTATSAPANGWNILPTTSDSKIYEKNKIDRSDVVDSNNEANGARDDTDKNFENDHFQPELQGGFKPIYPPGYKIEDDDEIEQLHQHETNNRPLALASRMETTTSSTTSSTSTSTSTTTTPKPRVTTSTTTSSTTSKPSESSGSKSNPEKEADQQESTTVIPLTPTKGQEISTNMPLTTPKPTERKKTPFETSLEALLFGDDEDFESEARKQKAKTISAPMSVPRMGPRSLTLS